MNILIVSYPFAPNGIVGAKRMSALANELSESGYGVDVLTTKLKYAAEIDKTLKVRVRNIQRTGVFLAPVTKKPSTFCGRLLARVKTFTSSLIFKTDSWQGWFLPALVNGLQMTSSIRYDCIIVSGPPFSSFFAAFLLSKIRDIKLVLDYRDAWTAYPWSCKVSTRARRMEKKIAENASACVFATRSILRFFQSFFPEGTPLLRVIPNGFNEYLIKQNPSFDVLRIGHAGTLYGERSFRHLIPVLKSLKIRSFSVELHHWGSLPDREISMFRNAGLENILVLHKRIPHSVLLEKLSCCNVLLALSGADVKYAIPYKVFDYISTGVPILAITPDDSELALFLEDNTIGFSTDGSNTNELETFIVSCLKSRHINQNPEFLWSNRAIEYGKLISLLKEING